MIRYQTNRPVISNVTEFHTFQSSHLKSMREDFNDMFYAEARARKSKGDLSLVFVLTYNDEHLFTRYGKNLLDANNLQTFSKSSAFAKFLARAYGYKFDYISIGEYGNGGESHNYVGKRGKGQNPHYHCVGWFSRIGDPDQIAIKRGLVKRGLEIILSRSMYDQMCLLVRWFWQHSLQNDPFVYARDKVSRKLGYGYVKLDGPIRYIHGGSAYISKYMGKSVLECYTQLYEANFAPNFLRYATIYCRLASVNALDTIALWYHTRKIDAAFKHISIQRLEKFVHTVDINFGAIYEKSRQLADLDELYKGYYADFYTDIYSRHSPKLRKFRGFGYVLIEQATMHNGTYTLARTDRAVCRALPPSLIRHFYYDYHVSINHRGEKVVRYTLNEFGEQLLKYRADSAISSSLQLISVKGSLELQQHAERVVLYNVCLKNYDILTQNIPSAFADVHGIIDTLLSSKSASIGWFVSAHQFIYEPFIYPESRTFVSVADVVRDTDPLLFKLSKELESLQYNKMLSKDSKDKEFLDNWDKIYKKSY